MSPQPYGVRRHERPCPSSPACFGCAVAAHSGHAALALLRAACSGGAAASVVALTLGRRPAGPRRNPVEAVARPV